MTNVSVTFPERDVAALTGVSLQVHTGEHVALLGTSGSGKSTLLRALLGAVAYRGTLDVDGLDPSVPAQAQVLRRRSGVVRQGSDLVLGVSGRLNAVMGTSAYWSPLDWITTARGGVPRDYRDRLSDLVTAHDVADCLDAPAAQLSGGQRQRLALVRALLPGPSLMLADEPTTGLDPLNVQRAVDGLRSSAGATLIVTTHDLAVARQFPRIVALREGTLVYDGPDLDSDTQRLVYGQTA